MVEESPFEDTVRTTGKSAQQSMMIAVRTIADALKTTLGPKGMDKMLVDRAGNITVTNDGVTILREMDIEHPAGKMLVDIANTQEEEVGDGTTTVVVLAGKLLEYAQQLLEKNVHPSTIIAGYHLAGEKAISLLNEYATDMHHEEELSNLAQTAMTGKGAEYLKTRLAELIVEAVQILSQQGKPNLRNIRIEKRKGSRTEAMLIHGIFLEARREHEQMPTQLNEATIALIEEALEIKKSEQELRVSITSPEQMQHFLVQEEQALHTKIGQIKKSGATCVFVKGRIDDLVAHQLAKAGILAVGRVNREDMKVICEATGAVRVARVKDLSPQDLGKAGSIEVSSGKEGEYITITKCPRSKIATVVLKGGSTHALEEVSRALEDALGVVSVALEHSKMVAGGGAVEMFLSTHLRRYASEISGREKMAIELYALALESIPLALAENAGMDPLDIITKLQAAHESGQHHVGLNLFSGKIEQTHLAGIVEPLKVKTQALSSARELAIALLRIDDIILAKTKKSSESMRSRSLQGYD